MGYYVRGADGMKWLLLVMVACTTERPAEAPTPAGPQATQATQDDAGTTPDVRARCEAHRDKQTCMQDPRCLEIGMTASGNRDAPQVIRRACLPCLVAIELRPLPREFCDLRAAGRFTEACLLMYPDKPERCGIPPPDAGVTHSM
jgi:hypothetical protein